MRLWMKTLGGIAGGLLLIRLLTPFIPLQSLPIPWEKIFENHVEHGRYHLNWHGLHLGVKVYDLVLNDIEKHQAVCTVKSAGVYPNWWKTWGNPLWVLAAIDLETPALTLQILDNKPDVVGVKLTPDLLAKIETVNFSKAEAQLLNTTGTLISVPTFSGQLDLSQSELAGQLWMQGNALNFALLQDDLVNLKVKLRGLDLRTILDKGYSNVSWYTWCQSHILKGRVDVDGAYQGKLADFPKGAHVAGKIYEGYLDYHQQWPKVTDITASFLWDGGNSAIIEAKQAKIAEAWISHLTTKFLDFDTKPSFYIQGLVGTNFKTIEEVILKSPLASRFESWFKTLALSGSTDLALELEFDFPGEFKTLRGKLGVKQAQVHVKDISIPFGGNIYFTPEQSWSVGLKGLLFDLPWKFGLHTHQKDPYLRLDGSGAVTISKKIGGKIYGNTPASLKFALQTQTQDWNLRLDSTLEGMTLNLPVPFAKKASTTLATTVRVIPHGEQISASVQLAEHGSIFAQFALQPKLEPLSVQIHLGPGAEIMPFVPSTLQVTGKVPVLDLSDALSNGLEFDWIPKQWTQQYAIEVEQLKMLGFSFKDISLQTRIQAGHWDTVRVYSKNVVGTATLEKDSLQLSFTHLQLPEMPKLSLITNTHMSTIKNIQFVADRFQYKNHTLTPLKFNLKQEAKGWRIRDVRLTEGSTQVYAKGFLKTFAPTGVTWEGQIESKSTGKMLQLWGRPSALQQAPGNFVFQLQWPGINPVLPTWSHLDGQLSMHLGRGRVQGVEPGLGRILGMLNIKLSNVLHWGDGLKKGFGFDTMQAEIQITQGIARTQSLELKGPSASLVFQGELNLATEQIAGMLGVRPNISGALPLAATLGAGPLAGAAVWVFDKVTNSALDVAYYTYKMDGTLQDPILKQVKGK